MTLDPSYHDVITALLDREHLDGHPESVFAIDRDGALVYVNAGWHRFAMNNGGQPDIGDNWSLGANYFDAIGPPLESFYRDLVGRAPAFGEDQAPLSHCYQCPGARVYREYNMLIYALPDQAGHLIVNSRVVERRHDPETHRPGSPEFDSYLDEHGLVRQCAHCRRMASRAEPGRWDWVPAWVETPPPNLSHGICPVCMEYYFSGVAAG
jgi:hypothetical protein